MDKILDISKPNRPEAKEYFQRQLESVNANYTVTTVDDNQDLKFQIKEKIEQLDDSIFIQTDYLSRNEYVWSSIDKAKISMQIEGLKEWQQWLEELIKE